MGTAVRRPYHHYERDGTVLDIAPELLGRRRNAIAILRPAGRSGRFTTAGLRAVNRITIDAIARLESLGPDDPLLPWVDVPHILHRGPIPVAWFSRCHA